MASRLELHELLCSVLETRNVYFQPPAKMEYPCVAYERSKIDTLYANGKPYLHMNKYTVTAIYRDPDSPIPHRIAALPECSHDRTFKNDNLYHDVFTIYF